MASHGFERLWLFGELVCVENDSDSVLQWVCTERPFKRGDEACWSGTLCAAALPAKGKD